MYLASILAPFGGDTRTDRSEPQSKAGRPRLGGTDTDRDMGFSKGLYFTNTDWILRRPARVFYIYANTVSSHMFVFGFCL